MASDRPEGPDPAPPSPAVPAVWPFRGSYYGWSIVISAAVASFASATMFGPVLAVFVRPIGDELGWTRATISLAFTTGSFAGSVFSAAIGVLLDRRGARAPMVVSGMLIAGCMLGLAAMTQPWHFWAFFGVGRGVAIAGIQSGIAVAIANWFIYKRGRATAFSGVGLRAGQATLPLVIHAIIVASSWRHAYATLAGMSFLGITVPAALFVRRRPEDLGLHPDGRGPDTQAAAGAAPGARLRPAEESWTLREAMRTRALWLIMFGVAFVGFAQTAVNLHAIANFQDKGITAGLSVSVTTIFATISSVTSLGWGFLLERLHVRYGAIIVNLLYVVAMVFIVIADTYPLAVLFGIMFGLAQGGWTIAQRLLFADYYGRRSIGAIRGFAAPIQAVVSPFGPLLAGFVRDRTGSYASVFTVFAVIFALVSMAMLLATPPKKPAAVPPTSP